MKKSPPSACNIIELSDGSQKLWRFGMSGNGNATLNQELTGLPSETLPARHVLKDWSDLWKHKLNLAWIPSDKVFFKVVEFPAADRDELIAMIELQLEKLSPLPLHQVVWSFELFPESHPGEEGMQTVIVIIASRVEVARHLGQLETKGYMADRLELPELHQLLSVRFTGDGIWFIPRRIENGHAVLMAWWFGGMLRQLGVANYSSAESLESELNRQVDRMAWVGEMEGWLTEDPEFHLVADVEQADTWRPVLGKVSGAEVTVDDPIPSGMLASLAAQRASRQESHTNLVPEDLSEKYRQGYVDRIWMRGLGTVLMLYMMGILVYFGALEVLRYQKTQLGTEVHGLSNSYTNTLITRARIQLLQEQISLKYAALESLKVASRELPDGLILNDFSFSRGKRVVLRGSAPASEIGKITDYNDRMRQAELDGDLLFSNVTPPTIGGSGANPQNMTWSFIAELKSDEIE